MNFLIYLLLAKAQIRFTKSIFLCRLTALYSAINSLIIFSISIMSGFVEKQVCIYAEMASLKWKLLLFGEALQNIDLMG